MQRCSGQQSSLWDQFYTRSVPTFDWNLKYYLVKLTRSPKLCQCKLGLDLPAWSRDMCNSSNEEISSYILYTCYTKYSMDLLQRLQQGGVAIVSYQLQTHLKLYCHPQRHDGSNLSRFTSNLGGNQLLFLGIWVSEDPPLHERINLHRHHDRRNERYGPTWTCRRPPVGNPRDLLQSQHLAIGWSVYLVSLWWASHRGSESVK